jgi:hypothetical protein
MPKPDEDDLMLLFLKPGSMERFRLANSLKLRDMIEAAREWRKQNPDYYYAADNTLVPYMEHEALLHRDKPIKPITEPEITPIPRPRMPKKGDFVEDGTRNGWIVWIHGDDVGVRFPDQLKPSTYDKDMFATYTSRGWRTIWRV